MTVCSFCKKNYHEHQGLTVFTFEGKALHYCSSKCRKNATNLRRDPKRVLWIRKNKERKEEVRIKRENSKKEREEAIEKVEKKKKNKEEKE
jgi:large subunit ribosomal protein L24e